MTIIYTGGTFDLFHSGHVNFLKRCRELAGINGKVVVGINSDEFITRYKKKPPVCSEAERKAVLESCRYVDEVVINYGDEDSKPIIIEVKPDLVVIGSDWAVRNYYAQMSFTQEWLDKRNIGLVYIPYTKEISTTRLRASL